MRAGAFQCAGGGLSPAARLDRLAGALEGAGLDLVVCPELFLSGYHAGDAVAACAEPCGGPFAQAVARVAARTGTAVVYGYPERDGDALYNAACCVAPSGEVVANHRKLALPPSYETELFTPGAGLTLFDWAGMRCAILICYEIEFVEPARAAALAGAEVLLVPTALVAEWTSVARRMIPTRAFENGLWLIYANHAGAEGGQTYLGESVVVAPDGREPARARAGEALIAATLDPAAIAPARRRLPYLEDLRTLRL